MSIAIDHGEKLYHITLMCTLVNCNAAFNEKTNKTKKSWRVLCTMYGAKRTPHQHQNIFPWVKYSEETSWLGLALLLKGLDHWPSLRGKINSQVYLIFYRIMWGWLSASWCLVEVIRRHENDPKPGSKFLFLISFRKWKRTWPVFLEWS